jgi:hypothetical protein
VGELAGRKREVAEGARIVMMRSQGNIHFYYHPSEVACQNFLCLMMAYFGPYADPDPGWLR